tara:strand:+ start:1010 stop:1783 length:774 start_codon:yes stop_codon:yes gene_type:complete
MKKVFSKRNLEILDEWNNNYDSTLQSIGNKYGLTRERVRQILLIAKKRGLDVEQSVEKTKLRNEIIKEGLIEEINIGLKHYGTLKYYEWRKLYVKQDQNYQRSKTLREILLKRWNEDLDPLFNFHISINLKPMHYQILHLKKSGKTLKQIGVIINRSIPLVSRYLRDLHEHDLYDYSSEKQVEAVRLDNFVIEKNLNHIRNELRQGKFLSQINIENSDLLLGKNTVRHYIRRHFLYPHYVNEKKRTERGNEAIVCLS